MTAIALVWANSPFSQSYRDLWHATVTAGIGPYVLSKPLELWINDGLMAVFFFVVGLEIKREILTGELASVRQAALPILAGLDKFTNLLANWDQYLAPAVANLLPVAPHTFMLAVGAIEIVAGIGVFFLPRVFAYVVSAWLVGIVVNLLLAGQYLDVALRDLGLAVGAFALGRLSEEADSGA